MAVVLYTPVVNTERFDRLLALRGDPVKGLPASAWATNLGDLDADQVLRAVIATTRKLLMPEWEARRPDDQRPQLAIAAAEAWLATKSSESIAQAKTTAKDCTAARSETFGQGLRAAEAARAIAWAVAAKDSTDIWDALTAIEGELLSQIALVGDYQKAPEQRRAIVEVLRKVLVPVEEAAPATASGPVPYTFSGSFSVGQQLVHAKFGNVVVTGAGDKWIDVQLEDGTTKRLAQKPK